MRVKYDDFPIFLSNGAVAAKLSGEFEASPNIDQQTGWYALRRVLADGTISDEVEANIFLLAFPPV